MCCQFSVFIFNTQYSYHLGTYYNIFFGYVETIFFVGALNQNVKMYHAVTATYLCHSQSSNGAHYRAFVMKTQSLDIHWKEDCI